MPVGLFRRCLLIVLPSYFLLLIVDVVGHPSIGFISILQGVFGDSVSCRVIIGVRENGTSDFVIESSVAAKYFVLKLGSESVKKFWTGVPNFFQLRSEMIRVGNVWLR